MAATKTRISVIGLLPRQAHQVVARVGRANVALRFVGGDEPTVPSADHLVIWIKFVGHRWTAAGFRAFPRNHVHLHTGGLARLAELIRSLAG